MDKSEGDASPQRAVTTERRRQLPSCLAPVPVALILVLAGVARWAEIATISALRFAPWPTPKSTATRATPVFQQSPKKKWRALAIPAQPDCLADR
jgi:hypothetical protein